MGLYAVNQQAPNVSILLRKEPVEPSVLFPLSASPRRNSSQIVPRQLGLASAGATSVVGQKRSEHAGMW